MSRKTNVLDDDMRIALTNPDVSSEFSQLFNKFSKASQIPYSIGNHKIKNKDYRIKYIQLLRDHFFVNFDKLSPTSFMKESGRLTAL